MQLLVFLVLAWLLSPVAFGLAALSTLFTTLSTLLTEDGLPVALMRNGPLALLSVHRPLAHRRQRAGTIPGIVPLMIPTLLLPLRQ